MYYFSKTGGGFFHPDVHGPRTRMVPDPAFVPPEDDKAAHAPVIEVANPDCKIPEDALEVSDERHAELQAAQAAGMRIDVGEDGLPFPVEVKSYLDNLTPEQIEAEMRSQRDRLLASSDWTQLPDADLNDGERAAWAKYRQTLRDVPQKTKDPAAVAWPKTPA